MEYSYSSNVCDCSGLAESTFRIFERLGEVRDIDIDSLDNADWDNINISDYIGSKSYFDHALFNYVNDDNVSDSGIMAWCYHEYDTGLYYLNFESTVSHFAIASPLGTYLNGYKVSNNSRTGYVGLNNPVSGDRLTTYTNNFTDFNVRVDYSYLNNIDLGGLIVDFGLSNSTDYLGIVTGGAGISVWAARCNTFVTTNSSILFKYGRDKTYTQAEVNQIRNDSFDLGKTSGFENGRSVGYQSGYYAGLADAGDTVHGPLSMVGGAVEQLTPIFGLEVLPNITLGTVISIPIICSIIVIIFRIARG